MKPVHAREGVSRASGSNIAGTFLGVICHVATTTASICEGCKCRLDCMDGWQQSCAVEANYNSCTQASFLLLILAERWLRIMYQAVKK